MARKDQNQPHPDPQAAARAAVDEAARRASDPLETDPQMGADPSEPMGKPMGESMGESMAETDGEGDADGPSLEELVEKLQLDADTARDAALRAQADAQNFKRRAEQDVEKARKFALESFCRDLLPVVDNLERALATTVGDEAVLKPIAEGVELTLKSFLDVLQKFNLEPVDPQGEPFDPQWHQAVTMVENNEVEPNTVTAVMQKGYTLNGRLVRPAMVMVSKPAES